jgi:hypothetical protein
MPLLEKVLQSLGLGKGGGVERCVACESRNLTVLAPGAYLCDDCGYEGGDGYAAYQQEQRFRAFDALDKEERHAGARGDLLEARRLLLAAKGSFESATSGNVRRILGDVISVLGDQSAGTDGHSEHETTLVTAEGYLLEASGLVRNAWYKLQGHPDGPLPSSVPEEGFWDRALGRLPLPSVKHQLEADKGILEANQMLETVERVLAEVFGVSNDL